MPRYTPGTTSASATASKTGGPTGTNSNEDIPASGWSDILVVNPTFTATGDCDTTATSDATGDRFIGRARIQYSSDGGSSWNDFGTSAGVDDLWSRSNAQNNASASDSELSNTQTATVNGKFLLSALQVRAFAEAECFSIAVGGDATGTATLTDWYVDAGAALAGIFIEA